MTAKLNIFSEITIKKRNDMIIDYKKRCSTVALVAFVSKDF